MLTVSQLLQFEPATLRESAGRWRLLADGVDDRGAGLRGDVLAWLEPQSWDGAAATAARGHVDGLVQRFTQDAERLHGIAGTLDTAADGLTQARAVLRGVVDTAGRLGLSVAEDGTVTPAHAVADPVRAARLRAVADQLTAAAVPVLAAATELDVATAAALADTEQYGSGGGSRGVEEDQAVADAERAAEILSSGTLDDDQLVELDTLLRDNAGDPLFASTFYAELGPELAMTYLDGLAFGVAHTPGPATVGSIQENMGQMLAMVTDPASPGYLGEQWTTDLLETETPQTDYPMLGVLLNSGDYSTEFLLATAEHFEEFENGDSSVWAMPGAHQLNYIGFPETSGYGVDPVTGLMSAFARNGEAAELFFDPGTHPDRIEYYLHGRDEVLPGVESQPGEPPSFYDTLGQALETAVGGDPHDAVSAHIMSETVYVLGDLELRAGDVPANMRDSVANMVGEYIGDVNASFTYDGAPGYPPPEGESANFDLDFDGAMEVPTVDEAHALFDPNDLLRAMAGAAEDPDAYATMYNAQAAYSGLVIGTTATETGLTPDQRTAEITTETEKLAYVFGALDEARASAVEDDMTSSDAAHNANAAIGEKIVGGITGFVWDEVVDSNPVTKVVKLGLDPLIDAIFGSQDSSEAMAREIAAIYQGGSEQAFTITRMIMEHYGIWEDDGNLKTANGDGYDTGAGDMGRALGES